MINSIKFALKRWKLARNGLRVELELPTTRYGAGTGSWLACAEGLGPDSVVYSFGVGRNLAFDLAMVERHQACVHAFDPTPVSIEWVGQQALPPKLVFHETGLADFDGILAFHAPRKSDSAHFTSVQRYRKDTENTFAAPVRTLRTIMSELGHERIDVLKLDIEGGEYDVIAQLVREAIPVAQVLVEFHHCYETIPFTRTLHAVAALRGAGYRIIAISERTYEFTFLHAGHHAAHPA